jgi:hypothetical protein
MGCAGSAAESFAASSSGRRDAKRLGAVLTFGITLAVAITYLASYKFETLKNIANLLSSCSPKSEVACQHTLSVLSRYRAKPIPKTVTLPK